MHACMHASFVYLLVIGIKECILVLLMVDKVTCWLDI